MRKWQMRKSNLHFYSWQEMGTYDLPAAIDYVMGHTGQKDLYYIGHSMGTTLPCFSC
jgi:lysosomal acid lipase/cholesteryl ester hydrolase